MALFRLVATLACLWAASGQIDDSIPDALVSDDACRAEGADSEACNLGMLQKRTQIDEAASKEDLADTAAAEAEVVTEEEANRRALALEEVTLEDLGADAGADPTQPIAVANKTLALPVIFGNRRSVPGVESCYGSNTGYCNSLMYRAHGCCGGSSCVQIVNPMHHRTRTPLHIHSYHYNGNGANLKRRLQSRACKSGGWVGGGFPCGGRAKFFRGYPPVFSVAKGAGSIKQASITVWPGSCHGGTIVLVGWHCSIEHSISRR